MTRTAFHPIARRLAPLVSLTALGLVACHGHGQPLEATEAEATYASGRAPSPHYTPEPSGPPAAEAYGRAESDRSATLDERPGLGTEWGEHRYSPVRSAPFSRADSDPFAVVQVYYNDPEGVRALTRGRFVSSDDCVVSVGRGAVTVTLEDANGRPLAAARDGERFYAVGRAGDRYAIRVHNHMPFRIEAVATVDGLDVIDGEEGDIDKRGYLISPYSDLHIDGFRHSEDSVAAFRFGSVRDSYAARSGRGRNIGVIGVAFFAERGDDWRRDAPYWSEGEIYRRETAHPFPSRFAKPPPPRW